MVPLYFSIFQLVEINEVETTEPGRLNFKVAPRARLKDINIAEAFQTASTRESNLRPQSPGLSKVADLSHTTREQSAPCWSESRVRGSGPSGNALSVALWKRESGATFRDKGEMTRVQAIKNNLEFAWK